MVVVIINKDWSKKDYKHNYHMVDVDNIDSILETILTKWKDIAKQSVWMAEKKDPTEHVYVELSYWM